MGMNVYIDTLDFHFDYNKEVSSYIESFFCNNPYYKIIPNYNVTYFLDKKEFLKLRNFIKKNSFDQFGSPLKVYKNTKEDLIYDLDRMDKLLRKNEKVKIKFN